ncbi:MAG: 4-hydroxy-tetrahydrodipicolinate synthase [Lactobacillaceae bacterium]|jgi:4-hydroxy-tetrahydrodipicolinate synthase|nr:4-hydroxy-tetrahydrodipicolinate synthase [Lactobacillaceae bacterium]
MITGVYPALITPFTKDDKIDFAALDRLIKLQLDNKVDGIVALGTTAETPCLTDEEKHEIISFIKQKIKGKCKLIIGAGGNCTKTTVLQAKSYLKYEPDAFLVVTPYYNKPNKSGMIEHFRQISDLGIDIVLYHIPGRTGQKLSVDLIEELVKKAPGIKAVKEADYDPAHTLELTTRLADKISILSGNDDMLLQLMSLGGKGIISAAANVLPHVFVELYKTKSFEIFTKAFPLIKACYHEVNPTCSKYILSKLGFCQEYVRLPLGLVDIENKKKIDSVLAGYERSFLFGEFNG